MNNIQNKFPKRFFDCNVTIRGLINGVPYGVANGKILKIKYGTGNMMCVLNDYEMVSDEDFILSDASGRKTAFTIKNNYYTGPMDAKSLSYTWVGEIKSLNKGGRYIEDGFGNYIERLAE